MASKGQQAWCCVLPSLNPAVILHQQCAWARDGRMMSASELAAMRPAILITDRHLPASVTQALTPQTIIMPLELRASSVLLASQACTQMDAAALQPLYPREPEAVTLWNQRQGRNA
jgi:hypothetical protein